MTLRYGVIGTGNMGQEHIRNLGAVDGVEVTAVADTDAGMREKAETLTGLTAYRTIATCWVLRPSTPW